MTDATIDRGDPKDWAVLDEEETRKVTMLKKYYKVADARADEDAIQLAWLDIQKEVPRLATFKWFHEVKLA